MEAASARMAARDRFSTYGEPVLTPLQRYIQNACDPQNFEPNLALNLEITDLINAKKGNAPREAAIAIVNYVNHRNPNVSILALSLLDICVKNCGYPFHLQISTKEFLNELVRRFPERPPIRPTRVQSKILELIEEWRQTICTTSKYKEDLGFIRDMHRLLAFKGYMFPEVKREDAAVLNPSDNLRSAEEMEEEERAAQSAKLQELIRRGTPRDLQEANKLMKVMAGYDTRNKTDYRAKAAEEVSKIQQKAKLLEEMLQGYRPGDEIKEGDVFEELANALQSAHPKIQKMCEEESEDHEAVAKLLEINDSIHRTIERYKLIKKGDIEGANKIPKGTLGTSGAGVSKGPDNELSLIDFGGPEDMMEPAPAAASSSQAAPPPTKGNALEDDLLGLALESSTYGQGGNISLFDAPPPASSTISAPATSSSAYTTPSIFTQSPAASSQTSGSASKPNYDVFSSIAAPQPKPAPSTPSIFGAQTQPRPSSRSTADPFASLAASSTPRQGSPFQFQQSVQSPAPPPSNSNNLLNLSQTTPVPAQAAQHKPQTSISSANGSLGGDDEWTFASALPDQSTDMELTNSSIKIKFKLSRPPGEDGVILINSTITNNTAQLISELTFQIAVTKGFSLKLEPQSSRTLTPYAAQGITQTIRLNGVERGKGGSVKMRWKASYKLGNEHREEQGELSNLGMS